MYNLPAGAAPLDEGLEDIAMARCLEGAVHQLVLRHVLTKDGSGALHEHFNLLGNVLCGRQDCNMCSQTVLHDLAADDKTRSMIEDALPYEVASQRYAAKLPYPQRCMLDLAPSTKRQRYDANVTGIANALLQLDECFTITKLARIDNNVHLTSSDICSCCTTCHNLDEGPQQVVQHAMGCITKGRTVKGCPVRALDQAADPFGEDSTPDYAQDSDEEARWHFADDQVMEILGANPVDCQPLHESSYDQLAARKVAELQEAVNMIDRISLRGQEAACAVAFAIMRSYVVFLGMHVAGSTFICDRGAFPGSGWCGTCDHVMQPVPVVSVVGPTSCPAFASR